MKNVKLIFLIVILLFLIAGQRQIKYFLSDRDFLSGKNIPKSEVVRKPHIRAEYDESDRLIVKSYIDRSGISIRQEQYSYVDTNTMIRQKDLLDMSGNIYQQTIFGRESHSLSYIEWVFGVHSVKKWDDRFTTSKLNDIKKPDEIVVARLGSPLCIGIGKNEHFIGSYVTPFLDYTKDVVYLED